MVKLLEPKLTVDMRSVFQENCLEVTKNLPATADISQCKDLSLQKSEFLERSKTTPAVEPKVKENRDYAIPRFYFPGGKPKPKSELVNTLKKISEAFQNSGKERLHQNELTPVTKACGYSRYWNAPFFQASLSVGADTVCKRDVISMWRRICSCCHDDASRFVMMMSQRRNIYLEFNDFLPLLQDIIENHPGLTFLGEATEFHSRYMNTVIARIFYAVNSSWSGQITIPELRRSNFLSILHSLEGENDINAVTDYFSYEHFYVIYCKFWELDTDHDLIIDKCDLSRFANGALSSRLIERLFSGAVTRWDTPDYYTLKMSYVDFVWFLISEEDKKSRTSIEYWFRCMDLDGDGMISMYEMEFFYEEQKERLNLTGVENLSFVDLVCQLMDMVKPQNKEYITLRDLKNSKMAHIFFNTFFNIKKYIYHEHKDPFLSQGAADCVLDEMSDWDAYAWEEYELLVADQHVEKKQKYDISYQDEGDLFVESDFENLDVGELGVQERYINVVQSQERKEVTLQPT